MPKLVVLSQGLTGLSYELKVEKTTVGRVDDNSFQIAEPSVSSHHCEFLLRGNDVVVNDLQSTNGTFINGKQVAGEAVLKPGQIVRLGQVDVRLEGPEGAPAKKVVDHTMVMPKGVKLDELSQAGTQPTAFTKNSPFSKKDNRGTKMFIGGAIVLFVIIIVVVVWAFMQSGTIAQ
jgi:pSer/pThr/pTyr-binding forkhead associated (FHA) protein